MQCVCPTDPRGRGRADGLGPRRRRSVPGAVPAVALALFLAACAGVLRPAALPARVGADSGFDPARDAFAFPNLVRAEHPGRPALFANYCIVMARAANQFFRFARFEPEAPPRQAAEYARLAGAVVRVPPWEPPRPAARRVVIPGYPDLRTFSRAQEAAVKAAFGSNLPSLLHPRTWRVALPLGPGHQQGVAAALVTELAAGRPVPLMLTNFPDADLLNHAVLVYASRPRSGVIEFLAYDPNDPGNPLSLHYDPGTQAFWVEPLPYSPPGRVRAFRLYTSPLL